MATLFAESVDAAPSPGFFKDSYQPEDDANLFDQAFSTATDSDPKVSTADALDMGILPTAPPGKSSYPYPSLGYGGPIGPYQTAELTPPASSSNSPTSWPLDGEHAPFGRASDTLPSLRTDANVSFDPFQIGQTTPPDDAQLDFPIMPAEPEPDFAAAPAKRGRKSKAASGAHAAGKKSAATGPKPRARKSTAASARAAAASSADDATEPAPIDPKRSVFLERNRIAAFKCRQKKKEQVARMETECRELARKKGARLLELEALNKEYFRLKSQLLEHARTGCDRAQGHVQRLLEQDRRKGEMAREMLGVLQGKSAENEELEREGTEEDDAEMEFT